MTIYHVRRRLRRARGNQFYRDRSDRGRGTFCGAPETGYDAAWAERKRAKAWDHPELGRFEPCPACLEAIERES